MLYFQYQSGRALIEREMESRFRQKHALLQSVLHGKLGQLQNQLYQLVEHLPKEQGEDAYADYRVQLDQLAATKRLPQYDLLILSDEHGHGCVDYSPAFLRHGSNCRQIISQYRGNSDHWHRFSRGEEEPPRVGLFTREPLLTRTGRVAGFVYGGIELTNNLSLVTEARALADSPDGALGLGFGDALLVSTAPSESAETQALQRLLETPAQIRFQDRDFTASGRRIALPGDRKTQLKFLAVISNDSARNLLEDLVAHSVLALAFSVLLAGLAALFAVRLTLSPLQRLLALAKEAAEERKATFSPGPVREFNQLSQTIADTVTDLKRSRQRLARYSQELESSNQQLSDSMRQNQSLLDQIIHLQEQERKHLAQELHDDLGQSLAVVRTDAYLIQRMVPPEHAAYQSAQSIYQNAQEMYDVVYRRITSLRPMPLNDLGLVDAIRFMPALESFTQHGIALELVLPQIPKALPESMEINLYRIVQEGLTNVLKHASASRAWVKLNFHKETVELEIGDNGVGIQTPVEPRMGYGFGLSGMMERARALGGSLEVSSSPSQGTLLKVSVPAPDTAVSICSSMG
nr:ATP-binding protein [Motiliproteus sp. SC1-56]